MNQLPLASKMWMGKLMVEDLALSSAQLTVGQMDGTVASVGLLESANLSVQALYGSQFHLQADYLKLISETGSAQMDTVELKALLPNASADHIELSLLSQNLKIEGDETEANIHEIEAVAFLDHLIPASYTASCFLFGRDNATMGIFNRASGSPKKRERNGNDVCSLFFVVSTPELKRCHCRCF
ncbi:MAG: hypothetical protein ACOXZ4_03490 [Sphaerochaetaceae bacterium]